MGKKHKKGGFNPNKSNQLQPSLFMQMRQKNGDSWLNLVSTDFIRKNALRIFKDLAYGNVNTDYEYQYFMNYDFTYNLAQSAYDNAKYCYSSYIGLYNSPITYQDPDMMKIMQEHYDRFLLFNCIVSHLNNILNDVSFNNGALVRFYLQTMVADIRWKKNAFKGYFITIPKEQDTKYVKKERRQVNNDYRFNKDDSGERGFFAQSDSSNMR